MDNTYLYFKKLIDLTVLTHRLMMDWLFIAPETILGREKRLEQSVVDGIRNSFCDVLDIEFGEKAPFAGFHRIN